MDDFGVFTHRIYLETHSVYFQSSWLEDCDDILLGFAMVIDKYTCPGCYSAYVGKTDNTMFNRTKQHGWSQSDSAVRKHFDHCEAWMDIVGVFQSGGLEIDRMSFQMNPLRENTEIIQRSDKWLKLSFLKSLAIKEMKPKLNCGLKSCKDLSLFW